MSRKLMIKNVIAKLSKLPQNAEVAYAELTAWLKDDGVTSYSIYESPPLKTFLNKLKG